MELSEALSPSILPVQLEKLAGKDPLGIYGYIMPDDSTYSWRTLGPKPITYGEVLRATYRAAHWLDENLGQAKDFAPFAYLAPMDVRYIILALATVLTQRKMILVQPMATEEAFCKLMDDNQCTDWIGSEETINRATQALSSRNGMRYTTIPDWSFFFQDTEVPAYPYTKTWNEAINDPIFVLLTSGTTGTPKSLPYKNAMMAVLNYTKKNEDGSEETCGLFGNHSRDKNFLWWARAYWAGGLFGWLSNPLFSGSKVIIPPESGSGVLPTPDFVIEVMENILSAGISIDGGFWLPVILKGVAAQSRGRDILHGVKFIMWAGGALDQHVGDDLSEYAKVVSLYGSTETFSLVGTKAPEDPQDWRYLKFESESGYVMEPVRDQNDESVEGLFELVLYRSRGKWPWMGAFIMFPDQEVYYMNDLFKPHPDPSKPDLWLPSGRKDDLVKLKWQTAVKAGDIENALERNDKVDKAVVLGDGRSRPAIIVQAHEGLLTNDAAAFQEEVWKMIQEVNDKVDVEVKIPKEHIIIADPARPFPLLSKGMVHRKATEVLYKTELDQIYGSN